MGNIGPAAVGGGINAASQIGHDLFTADQNRQYNQWQEYEAGKARTWDFGMWQLQNMYNRRERDFMLDYNSPAKQMERFQEAGLNPHLIYGKGTAGNLSAPTRAGEPEPYKVPDRRSLAEGIDAFQMENPFLQAAQLDNIAADIQVKRSLARSNALKNIGMGYDNVYKAEKAGVAPQLVEAQLSVAQHQARKLEHEAGIAQVRKDIADATKQTAINKAGWEVSKLYEEAQYMRGKARIQFLEEGIKQLELEWKQKGITDADNVWTKILFQNPEVEKLIKSVTEGVYIK